MAQKGQKSQTIQKAQRRKIILNVPEMNLPSNSIKSTSTNALTFIPVNLIHQFKSLANVYFILIAILQTIPAISLTGGKPTILIPLSVVMLTVMIKDATQQFRRYLKDKQQNSRPTQILTQNGFVADKWQNIKVGHVIKIKKDQQIPCDAIIIKTTLPQNKCYVETKGLDGQTNYKNKFSGKSKYNNVNLSNAELYTKRYEFNVQAPNHDLKNFQGAMSIENQNVPLSMENMILRGCNIRNVSQVICVSVYTGSDSKVILNSAKFHLKNSKLNNDISKMIISIFIWQVVIALVVSMFNNLFEGNYAGPMEYIQKSRYWFLASSWWLIMTYFVPISLTVTMQMVKMFQGFVLARDERGYTKEYDCFCNANNTSVNENLGQIRYVFTDKTGTLTKNQMVFQRLIIGNHAFGVEENMSEAEIIKDFPLVTNVYFRDRQLFKKINQKPIQDALKIIYLCHDVSVNVVDGQNIYTSSSPQQVALLNFAKFCGYEMMGIEQGYIKIFDRRANRVVKYQRIALFEADSSRKRMSVVIRNPNNQIQILIKGADSKVMSRLNQGMSTYKNETQTYVNNFSDIGLRTMAMGQRKVTQDQFRNWKNNYDKAAVALQNRKQKMFQSYQTMEKNFQLVGAVAIQDKLQDCVSDTIKAMKASGIKFFILTGDKRQTAISIGKSCGLVQDEAKLIDIKQYTQAGRTEWLAWMRKTKQQKGDKVYLLDLEKPIPPDLPLHQTICYRCSPKHKQQIVSLVKNKTPQLTLAIGDGSNDVNMITAADVGVGVMGKQGTQATKVSDFVIGQYSHLTFLTLYYGSKWYKNNCRLVAYNFYKNWYHVSAVICYGAYSFFSATLIFDIYLYQMFNLFFTSVPIIVYAVLDQQFTFEQSLTYPSLYTPGLTNKQFNQSVYHKSIGKGALYGFVSLVIIFMCLEDNVLASNGRMGYLAQSGAILYSSIVTNINFRILILSTGLTPFIIFSVYGSIIFYWFFYFLYVKTVEGQLSNSIKQQWTTIMIILVQILVISLITFCQYAYEKYFEFDEKVSRLKSTQNITDALVKRLLLGQTTGLRDSSGGNFLGKLLNVPSPDYKNRRVMEPI